MITTTWPTSRHDVAVVTIDRHERRNALDHEHCDALTQACSEAVAAGSSSARAIVVTGTGSTFCAGADLDAVYDAGFRAALTRLLTSLPALPVPVIAAVNGPAIGAGSQLALACDLRVAGAAASFAIPTARNGLAVDAWTVRRLTVLAGGGPARAVLLGADVLDRERAVGLGLADRHGELDAAIAWAEEIATLAPLSLQYSKLALELPPDGDADDLRVQAAFEACWDSEDRREAQRARAERRAAVFRGR